MLSIERYEFPAGFLSCPLGFYYSFLFLIFLCFETFFSDWVKLDMKLSTSGFGQQDHEGMI